MRPVSPFLSTGCHNFEYYLLIDQKGKLQLRSSSSYLKPCFFYLLLIIMSICPHIQQVFQNEKSKDGVLKTCNAARYILNHSVPKEKFLNTMKCGTCHEINSGATFMCLQCGFCGCWNHSHFLSHSKQIGHIFGINSNNGLLFCFKCEDYIGNIDRSLTLLIPYLALMSE